MLKRRLILIRKRPDLDFRAFDEHWAGPHAKIVVDLITQPTQAQQVLDEDSADAIFLGRVALREAAWPLRAAHELGVAASDAPYPAQYRRGTY